MPHVAISKMWHKMEPIFYLSGGDAKALEDDFLHVMQTFLPSLERAVIRSEKAKSAINPANQIRVDEEDLGTAFESGFALPTGSADKMAARRLWSSRNMWDNAGMAVLDMMEAHGESAPPPALPLSLYLSPAVACSSAAALRPLEAFCCTSQSSHVCCAGYMLVSISKTDGPSGGMAAIFRKPA